MSSQKTGQLERNPLPNKGFPGKDKQMIEQEEKTAEEQAAEAIDAQQGHEVPPPDADNGKREPTKPAPGVREVEVHQWKPAEIAVRDGQLVPQTLTDATRIAKGLMESQCLPKHFKTVPQVIMAMQMLRQLGLPDIACLPRLCIINGSFSLWGEGPKAICQPDIEDFDEFWFDAQYKKICFEHKNLNSEAYGAICCVKRRGVATWVERPFTVDDAKQARLLGKSGPWQDYPRRMMQMRARSWALKDAFPDRLMGLGIAEYDHNALVGEGGEIETAEVAPKAIERFK